MFIYFTRSAFYTNTHVSKLLLHPPLARKKKVPPFFPTHPDNQTPDFCVRLVLGCQNNQRSGWFVLITGVKCHGCRTWSGTAAPRRSCKYCCKYFFDDGFDSERQLVFFLIVPPTSCPPSIFFSCSDAVAFLWHLIPHFWCKLMLQGF